MALQLHWECSNVSLIHFECCFWYISHILAELVLFSPIGNALSYLYWESPFNLILQGYN
jgi:hypothetical protein